MTVNIFGTLILVALLYTAHSDSALLTPKLPSSFSEEAWTTPALRHDQVPKKESSKPSMNLRPQVHPHIRNS